MLNPIMISEHKSTREKNSKLTPLTMMVLTIDWLQKHLKTVIVIPLNRWEVSNYSSG